MATIKPKAKAKSEKKPLRVKMLNASGQEIEGIIPGAETLAVTDEVHNAKEVATKAVEGRKQARRSKVLAYIRLVATV